MDNRFSLNLKREKMKNSHETFKNVAKIIAEREFYDAQKRINQLIEKDPNFTEDYIEEALTENNLEKASESHKAAFGNLVGNDNRFQPALNKKLDTLSENKLVKLYNVDLGKESNKKVIIKLAKRFPETFKTMLVDSNTRQVIKKYKLTGLEVSGESLLKSCIHNDQLTAIMMKDGFTLSDKETQNKYKGQELTVNDHLRIAIATKAEKLDDLDLSKKQSPLALAREMGQKDLAGALKDQGFKLKKTELMARKMKNALGEIKATYSSMTKKLPGKRKETGGRQ